MAKKPRTKRQPRDSQASVWFESFRVNSYLVTVFAVFVFGILSLAPVVQIWFQQRQEIADYQTQVQQAKEDLKNMQVQRERWDDPVYIRSQARSRLYYVLPGEVSFLVMDADGVNLSDTSGTVGARLAEQRRTTQITTSIIETRKNWVDNIVESVIRAGLEEPVSANATN